MEGRIEHVQIIHTIDFSQKACTDVVTFTFLYINIKGGQQLSVKCQIFSQMLR